MVMVSIWHIIPNAQGGMDTKNFLSVSPYYPREHFIESVKLLQESMAKIGRGEKLPPAAQATPAVKPVITRPPPHHPRPVADMIPSQAVEKASTEKSTVETSK